MEAEAARLRASIPHTPLSSTQIDATTSTLTVDAQQVQRERERRRDEIRREREESRERNKSRQGTASKGERSHRTYLTVSTNGTEPVFILM